MTPFRWVRFKLAWWRWFLHDGPQPGDPSHGHGEQRRVTRALLIGRWLAREPKREDFL